MEHKNIFAQFFIKKNNCYNRNKSGKVFHNERIIHVYKMLNKSKIQAKESAQPLLNIDNINLANSQTKPKLEVIKNNFISIYLC